MSIDLSCLPDLLPGQSYAVKFGFCRDRLDSHEMITALKRRTIADLATECGNSRRSRVHFFEVYGFHTRPVFDQITSHLIDSTVDPSVQARVDRSLGQNRSLMFVAICVVSDDEAVMP